MAGLYDGAAEVLGVKGTPRSSGGFDASEAVNILTSTEPQAESAPPSKWIPDSGPELQQNPSPKPPQSLLRRLVGSNLATAEAAGTLATGAVAAPIAAVAGLYRGLTGGNYGTQKGTEEARARAAEVMQSLTYQPRSEEGQDLVGGVAKVLDASKIAGLGPTEGMALGGTLASIKAPRTTLRLPGRSIAEPQMASVGAAAVSPAQQVESLAARASPEVQAMIKQVGAEKINPVVLERHIDSESLPIPVHLTRGQATQNAGRISVEQNMRGAKEPLRNRFTDQNNQLIDNTNAIREAAAPDVYATTNPEIGQMVIDSYVKKDAAANAKIASAYKALKEANGGQFPLDANAFVSAADKELHKGLLFDHVPPEIRRTLDRVKEGGMTFENFESLRTNLARIQRSQSADGNAKAAAGVIRQTLEDLPMPAEAAHLKPLADTARSLAKERFAAIEADPAYKAVVSGKASADKLIDKFVINADLKNLQTMKENLDPAAQQALAAGTINHLKRNAGIVDNAGNFSQAGYNKALESLRPKLGVLFEPTQREQVEALGRVARYTQAQPRGSFVNNSNTFTAAVAERAKGVAEGGVNLMVPGLNLGTWGRNVAKGVIEQRELDQILKPGAGILLKDIK